MLADYAPVGGVLESNSKRLDVPANFMCARTIRAVKREAMPLLEAKAAMRRKMVQDGVLTFPTQDEKAQYLQATYDPTFGIAEIMDALQDPDLMWCFLFYGCPDGFESSEQAKDFVDNYPNYIVLAKKLLEFSGLKNSGSSDGQNPGSQTEQDPTSVTSQS